VRHAAEQLGIHEWRAGVTPADKIVRVEDLKRRGVKVLMVGDGMNDAPALAATHVSMSPVSATHLSQATTDLVFLGDRLAPVVAAIGFSRKALLLMRQNLWLAAGYNLLAVPLAIAGLATPLVAAAAMSGSSLLVILNAGPRASGFPLVAQERAYDDLGQSGGRLRMMNRLRRKRCRWKGAALLKELRAIGDSSESQLQRSPAAALPRLRVQVQHRSMPAAHTRRAMSTLTEYSLPAR
jgi:haloacid dehalogenase-like hydrolase